MIDEVTANSRMTSVEPTAVIKRPHSYLAVCDHGGLGWLVLGGFSLGWLSSYEVSRER